MTLRQRRKEMARIATEIASLFEEIEAIGSKDAKHKTFAYSEDEYLSVLKGADMARRIRDLDIDQKVPQ